MKNLGKQYVSKANNSQFINHFDVNYRRFHIQDVWDSANVSEYEVNNKVDGTNITLCTPKLFITHKWCH